MFEDFAEQTIKNHCPHCDRTCWVFDYLLEESPCFCVLCDANPLIEGHILIIPKRHVSCMGEYTPEEFLEFKGLYSRISEWIHKKYGSVATFEHGKIGQTVFHSHIHLMPYMGQLEQIIPEGKERLQSLQKLEDLIDIFQKNGQYLFLSIGTNMWTVDLSLGSPRFFRDRFARAFNEPERSDWKEIRKNPVLLVLGHEDNKRCQEKFIQK